MLCVHSVGVKNLTMGCWEINLNLSHPMVIFGGLTKQTHNVMHTMSYARAHMRARTHTHIDTNNAYDWDNSNFDVFTLNL